MSELRGTFIWYELLTTDVPGAIAFYRDAIGWGTEKFEGGDKPYTIWTAAGMPLGGVMTLPDEAKQAGAPPHWFAHVAVDDVDALTRKAVSLGGTTRVPPQDIPTVGRFSVIADPQGATLALFKGNSPEPPPRPSGPTHGHFVWHELLANDWEAALRFYAALFGWQKSQSVDMGAMGTYQLFGKNGRDLGGMMNRPPGYPLPPHWVYYVRVDDLDATLARVKRAGGTIWNGPMAIPNGERIAQCADPQGATFALQGV